MRNFLDEWKYRMNSSDKKARRDYRIITWGGLAAMVFGIIAEVLQLLGGAVGIWKGISTWFLPGFTVFFVAVVLFLYKFDQR